MIRLSKSCLSDAEKKSVIAVLDKEFLGMGEETKKFEEMLTEYFDREVVCVNTGTAALQLALQSAGVGKGDEVLVQSLTYVASYQAISATGALPVACEVEPFFCSIDLKDAEQRITKNTKAIMPVHYAGQPGDLEQIYDFANLHGLRVIEDAAHAFGSYYNQKLVGSFGDTACFSFDGIKNITSGEGGCIVSSDQELINRVKDLRLLGVEKDSEKRYAGQRSWEFDVTQQGWRYHMSNVMAAIGIEQFKRFPAMAQKRQRLAEEYNKLLANITGVTLFNSKFDEIVPHIYPVKLDTTINKEQIRKNLESKGIQTGIHYLPNHLLSFYKTAYTLPTTEMIYQQLLTLPLHYDLSFDDVSYVVSVLDQELRDFN